eukprot:g4528.t1
MRPFFLRSGIARRALLARCQSSAAPTAGAAPDSPVASSQLGRWGWALDALGLNSAEGQRNAGSELVFASALQQSREPSLAAEFQLRRPAAACAAAGDEVEEAAAVPLQYRAPALPFRLQHALLMLHVWVLHRHLAQSGEEGKLLQEALFDRTWEHSILMIRALGVNELSVNKHLKELQKVSFGALMSYDTGLSADAGDDDGGAAAAVPEELAGALYRNLYARDESAEEEAVLALAGYARRQLDAVRGVAWADLLEGRIPWDGAGLGEAAAAGGADGGAGEWRMAMDQRGRTYWWHTRTREAVWEDPVTGEDGRTRIEA